MKQLMKNHFPLNFSFANFFFTAIYIFYYISLQTRSGIVHPTLSFEDVFPIVTGLITVNLLVLFLNSALSFNKNIYFFVLLIVFSFYNLLGSYTFRTKIHFDYSVMADNGSETFNINAMSVIFDSISFHVFLIGTICLLMMIFIKPLRNNIVNRVERKNAFSKSIIVASLYLLIAATPYAQHDEISSFGNSIYNYIMRDKVYLNQENIRGTYPLIKVSQKPVNNPPEPEKSSHPNIIFLMVESFSNRVVQTKTEKGEEFTPFFNKKIKEGVFVERFYSNTIQSSKGQFAALFSLIPSIKHKVFTTYTHVKFRSLPEILKEHGYTTMFFKAYKDINYDNTGNFMALNGSDINLSIDKFLTKEDRKHVWGWGVEDRIFYKRFFEYVDQNHEKDANPVFAVLHTVMNHQKFNNVPKEKRHLYPEPKTFFEKYANSMHLTDKHLAVFFDELEKRNYFKNTIVVITGDHSFPTGEHGYTSAEVSYYEEFYRMPLLVLWKGKLAPQYIADKIYDQLDIAPSLLDLANIHPQAHHFMGQSIFSDSYKEKPIYQIQPYNGGYLSVVEYPFKYVLSLKTGKELIYDLQNDAMEQHNIIETISPITVGRLKNHLNEIYQHQYLLEVNEIWNSSKAQQIVKEREMGAGNNETLSQNNIGKSESSR